MRAMKKGPSGQAVDDSETVKTRAAQRDCVERLCNSRPPVFLSVSLTLIRTRGPHCVAELCSNRPKTVPQTVKTAVFSTMGETMARPERFERPTLRFVV